MSITTSQQINRYYEQYATIDVTFTKEVTKAVGLVSKQVFLKCFGYQWPCIVFSSSMTSAKVIISANPTMYQVIRKANNLATLRFCFRQNDKSDNLPFYVSSRIVGFTPYNQKNPNLNFASLVFTQRPADALIESLGMLLEANINSQKRQEERIVLTIEALKRIGMSSKECTVLIENVPRKAIVRDISFSGVKILLMGVAKFLLDKPVLLRIDFSEPPESLQIPGKIIRHEEVEGRKDIAAFAIRFSDNAVPMSYKLRINEYLRKTKKKLDTR